MNQQPNPCNAYHTSEQRWITVLTCDVAADGMFVYVVRTTGAYYRPGSSTRRPRRESVGLFTTAETAEVASYRPSRHTAGGRSLVAEQRAKRVTQACQMIEATETPLILEVLVA